MGTFEVKNMSSLRDSVAVARVGMYMACNGQCLVDSSGKQIINIQYRTLWPDKNIYTVTDYEG